MIPYPSTRVVFLTFLLTILTFCSLRAQDGGRNKAVYAEVLGNGLLLSLNYDFRFKPTQDGLGMRAGIGGAQFTDQSTDSRAGIVTAPVMLNYLIGSRRAAFEAGAGVTMFYISVSGTRPATGELVSGKGFGVAGALAAGLRLQPIRNGVVFRLNWTPMISNEGFQPKWLGISLGYGFK